MLQAATRKKLKLWTLGLLLYVAGTSFYLSASGQAGSTDWQSASRESGLAPDPGLTPEAVVQVYAARAARWRGYFGVHTWIAVKRSGAKEYTVHEIMGFRLRRTGTALVSRNREPDGRWYGSDPDLLSDLRGEGVDPVIDRIEAAIARYPYADTYRVWPGPNSNTFTAFIAREVPELRLDLPPHAIGKDYLGLTPVRKSPSGTGAQLNLFGAAGVLVGLEEGLEVNLLGLTFGVDPRSLSIKLPLLGRIGPNRNAKAVILAPESTRAEAVADTAVPASDSVALEASLRTAEGSAP